MSDVLRVLLVEDDPGQVELTQRRLAKVVVPQFVVEHAGTLAAATMQLSDSNFDVILLDLGLPDSHGIDTLRSIHSQSPHLPIVVVTSQDDESIALETLEQGAQHYLIKTAVTSELLVRSIEYAIGRQRISAENKRLFSEVQTANQQLREKNANLARVYQTAQQFVDNVSHDFRTPLTVIKEFSSIMREGLAGQVNSQQQEFLDTISDRVDDLAMMVDDMLDASKLEAGMLCCWRREASLGEIVNQVQRTLQRKAALKNIPIEVEIPANVPAVFCDSEKICRVLINLAVNAIKFSPEGKPVRIWGRYDTDHAEIQVGVTDQGPGISPENQARLFQRFHQLEETILENSQGFGLGLAIARELVQLNLGELNVKSQLGQGSTFFFTLSPAEPRQLIAKHLWRLEQLSASSNQLCSLVVRSRRNGEFGTEASTVIDEFLQHMVRNNDLVLTINQRVWLALVRCPPNELDELVNRLQTNWQQQSRACPAGQLPDLYFEKGPAYALTEQLAGLTEQLMDQYQQLQQVQNCCTKVLLVDDDRDIVRGLAVRLKADGYEISSAHDGVSGFEAAMRIRPDAMILDMRMPGMNGMEVMSQMSQHPETRNIPVIVLSASLRDQQPALDKGARYFLDKPCDPRTLLAALHTVAAPSTN
ncbi:MAG TPA: response regulator [Pirellulales bacterium]